MLKLKFMHKFLLISLILIFSWLIPALAQDDQKAYDLERIIVTATKSEADASQVGTSSSVVTARQMEEQGAVDTYEYLRGLPGLDVSHSGGEGGLTDIYIRGSKPGHTLIMLDGVEINDPMTTDRSFDFTHLPMDNVARVEVIRGPQSTLYGSDAMAGVVNVITKKGSGKPKLEVTSEAGTHGTFHESTTYSGSQDKLDYSFSYGKFDSSGISMAKDGVERDRQQSYNASSRLGYQLSEDVALDFVLRQDYSITGLDDAAFVDDPNYTAWYRHLVTKFEVDQKLSSWWKHKLSFSHFEAKRKYRDEPDSASPTEDTQSWYKGTDDKVEWQHIVDFTRWDTLTAGFEHNEERGASSYRSGTSVSNLPRKVVTNEGYYMQNQFKLWESLFLTPAVRLDHHELFGNEVTYKMSSVYLVRPTSTRLKYNFGTGFKAPSIYQLYSTEDFGGGPIGDPNLKPDKSKSYDFGFEQDIFERKASFGATYFYNNFKNMVDYDLTANKYKNVGKVKTKGAEVNIKARPVTGLDIGLSYTYTKTRDDETGMALVRRSQDQAGLDVNWLLFKKLNLNWKTIFMGHNWDDTANTIKVKQYSKTDLSLAYTLSKNFKVFTRVENLLDRKYQEVLGYSTSGRAYFGGFKGEF